MTTKLAGDFIARRLTATEMVRVLTHLENCTACGELVDEQRRQKTATLSRAPLLYAFQNQHLEYDHLLTLAEDDTDGETRKFINQHLESCARCRQDVKDFLSFNQKLKAELSHRYQPETETRKFLRRLSAIDSRRQSQPSLIALLMILCLGIIIAIEVKNNIKWEHDRDAALSRRDLPPTVYESSASSIQVATEKVTPRGLAKPDTADFDVKAARPPARRQATAGLGIFDNQHYFSVAGGGIETLPHDVRVAVAAALQGDLTVAALRDDLPVADKITTRNLIEMDAIRPVKLLYPVATILLQDRPLLRWQPIAGADSYQVTIVDTNFNVVASSPVIRTTVWQPSSPLPRGSNLKWQVTPYKNNRKIITVPNTGANFQVISQAKYRYLERARRRLSSHLALGVLYAREGLLNEAECELKQLHRRNPRSRIVRRLLRKVQHSKPAVAVNLKCEP